MFKFKIVLSVIIMMLMCVTLPSCYNGKLAYADNSVTQTNNIDVKVDKETKKAFALGVDSENRIARYGRLGELIQINVTVAGSTSLNDLKTTTTKIDNDGKPTNSNENTSYFTDYIKIKIRMPKNTTKVNFLDGRGAVKIDTGKQVEDGYFKQNIEWVKLDKDLTNAKLNNDEGESNKYLYIEFLDDDNNSLAEYFVCFVFSVTIR